MRSATRNDSRMFCSIMITPTPRWASSVALTRTSPIGGAHPQTFYKAFNWDQGLRRPIVLDPAGQEKIQPLFQLGTNPWPIIFPLVETDLEKQLGTKPAIAPQVGMNPATYENFAIQNDTLMFFFGQGAVLPESAGALSVTIPRPPIDRMIAYCTARDSNKLHLWRAGKWSEEVFAPAPVDSMMFVFGLDGPTP